MRVIRKGRGTAKFGERGGKGQFQRNCVKIERRNRRRERSNGGENLFSSTASEACNSSSRKRGAKKKRKVSDVNTACLGERKVQQNHSTASFHT